MSDKTKNVTGESKLDKFIETVTTVGGAIGNQRHMAAIRDGFGTFLPLIIIGALAVMFNSVFVTDTSLLATLFYEDGAPQA